MLVSQNKIGTKVHKPVINNCPKFRPILSTIGTPTYKLAKFLVPILSPLTSNQFSVHDSFSFADKVSSFCPDHFMTSLDIESLFTNIPLNEVIDICIEEEFTKNYDEDSDKGYILKVDVEYTKELNYLHSDLQFLPEKMKINKCTMLVCNLFDKENY